MVAMVNILGNTSTNLLFQANQDIQMVGPPPAAGDSNHPEPVQVVNKIPRPPPEDPDIDQELDKSPPGVGRDEDEEEPDKIDTEGDDAGGGGNVDDESEEQTEKRVDPDNDAIQEIKDSIKDIKENIKDIKEGKVDVKKDNETKVESPSTGNETLKQAVLKNVENKVMAIGESVKNKTLEKLADLGVYKKKEYEKLVYQRTTWNLSLTVEDIGNIMKDTEYFQKRQNLTEMEYQPLKQPGSNVTLNVTTSKYGLGYCDCEDLKCLCCVRIFNKRMRLNSTSCAAIVFSSKSQVRHCICGFCIHL